MGRGKSNSTKLYWAVQSYNTGLEPEQPDTLQRKLQKQLLASRWFKKHFVQNTPNGLVLAQALDRVYLTHVNTRVLWWYNLALVWPLDKIVANIKTKGVKNANKFLYLAIKDQDKGTEIEHRQRAQFYLILIQHFMGRAEAQKLLKHYKTEGVKYRKLRADRGLSLSGEALVEFRMRLGGHTLLVPPLDRDEHGA